MSVIDDVVSGLRADWNESTVDLPDIYDGAYRYSKLARSMHPFGGGEIIWVTNPRSNPRFVDPERKYRDTSYEVNVDIESNNSGNRDLFFDEVYRIIEATGVSGYDNRVILEYKTENNQDMFKSIIRFTMIKYNESAER